MCVGGGGQSGAGGGESVCVCGGGLELVLLDRNFALTIINMCSVHIGSVTSSEKHRSKTQIIPKQRLHKRTKIGDSVL